MVTKEFLKDSVQVSNKGANSATPDISRKCFRLYVCTPLCLETFKISYSDVVLTRFVIYNFRLYCLSQHKLNNNRVARNLKNCGPQKATVSLFKAEQNGRK